MKNTTKAAKTDNFLKAIRKYAEQQSSSMRTEVEQIKEEKLKKAEENGKKDSERYIVDQLEHKRNAEASKLAKLIQESQKNIFLERAEMTEKVFEMAEEKLLKYTQTAEYKNMLFDCAAEISKAFEDNDCVIYLNERDIDCSDKIIGLFGGKAEIQTDRSVKIGGIKGFCEALGIIADETLDTRLAAQKEWFIENSGLSVL